MSDDDDNDVYEGWCFTILIVLLMISITSFLLLFIHVYLLKRIIFQEKKNIVGIINNGIL